jgi:hypothetical protein
MSRTSGSHSRRPLAAAGVLALVGLATPATATHAQSINPERAPLNPTPVVSYRLVPDTPGPWRTLDGEEALWAGIDNGNIACNIDAVNIGHREPTGAWVRCPQQESSGVFLGRHLTTLCSMTTLSRHVNFTRSQRSPQMSAPFSGLPAASSVQQSIVFAQLELLRRLDPARVEAAKSVLLRN